MAFFSLFEVNEEHIRNLFRNMFVSLLLNKEHILEKKKLSNSSIVIIRSNTNNNFTIKYDFLKADLVLLFQC